MFYGKFRKFLMQIPPLSPSPERLPPAESSSREELQCRLAIYQGLVRVSAIINSITSFDAMLEAVIEVAREVFDAEAVSLFFPTANQAELELTIASVGTNVKKNRILVPRGRGVAWWVWEQQQTVLIPDAYQDDRFYREADKITGFHTKSILCAPLIHEHKPIAVLQVLNPRNKSTFDLADLEAINGYSTLIATALEKLRAIEERRHEELLHRDLAIAAEIQQGLLARAIPPALRNENLYATNQAALEVGGDFYFATENHQGDLWFAIGDVSGKGIAAALLMTQTLDGLRFLLRGAGNPASILQKLNQMVQEVTVRGMFVTVLLGRFSPRKHRMEIASAGHCHPWILPATDDAKSWELESSFPIGILPDATYKQASRAFHPHDQLLLFTDGLSESRPHGSQSLLIEQFPTLLQNAPKTPRLLADYLLTAEATHRGATPLRDDLTIFAIRHP